MRIEDFDSDRDLTAPVEIEAALSKRHGAGINSFWLSHGLEKRPAINIMINGDLAYIHYLPDDHHPGFTSVGGMSQLRPGGTTDFFLSPSDEPLDLLNDGVVPFSSALKVAQEFAISSAMPKCIAWRSLARPK